MRARLLNIRNMDDLTKIIGDMDGGDPSSLVNPQTPNSADDLPSLSDIAGSQEESSSGTDDSGEESPASDGPVRKPGETAAQFNFRQRLHDSLGVSPDEFEDDDEAFEAYTAAISQAAEILQDEQYQEYLKSRESAAAPEPQSQAAAPSAQESPVEEQSGNKNSDIFSEAEVSGEAQILAQQGLIQRGEDGVWVAKNPALKSFADEYNRHDMAIRTNVLKFSRNPQAFIREILEKNKPADDSESPAIKKITALEQEIQELKNHIKSQRETQQRDTIEQWQKTAPLRGDDGKLTPYAKEYMKWEKEVRALMPKASNVEVHERVLRSLELAGVKAEAGNKTEKPEREREPFAAKAERRSSATNGNGVNRLREFAGEAPASSPSTLTGKAGLPDLNKTIAQMSSAFTD